MVATGKGNQSMENRNLRRTIRIAVTIIFTLAGLSSASAQLLKPGEIVYSRATQGNNCLTAAIWVVGLDGSNDRFITNGLHPRISPDGRYLLFKRFDGSVACGPFTNGAPQFWIRELATGRETQLVQNFSVSTGHFFSPDTNRAGSQIISSDGGSVCTMNLDGSNRFCVSPPVLSPINSPGYMTVRSDGLTVIQNYQDQIQRDGLYMINYNLTNPVKIPNTAHNDSDPTWSNDGQQIAYAVFSDAGRAQPYWMINLFKINPDGTGKTQLTNVSLPPSGEGFSYSIVWTLDNSTLLNAAKLNGVAGIYKIDANGGGVVGMIPITPGSVPEWVGGIVPPYSEQQTASFGAGLTTGGGFSLVDTVGQAFAGQTSAAGQFSFQSGFWTIPAHHAVSLFDFDGDYKTDLSIFRPNGATGSEWWYLKSSNGGNFATQFGTPTDKLVAADYTGDGKADIAFWRPSTGEWFILRSEDSSFYAFPFGASGDIPAPADYDGDGKADAAVFRSSNSTWFIQNSGGGTTIKTFGSVGDVPVVADYDGDGKADLAIFRPNGATGSEWWISKSSGGTFATQFGVPTDRTVPGDYTGDGKADIAFWRPATGQWYILRSEDLSFFAFPFGSNGDIPVPGDYDGDGKTDAAVFRPSSSTWFAQGSTSGTIIQQFGAAGDVPVPSEFVR